MPTTNNLFQLTFPDGWRETTVYTFEGPFESGVLHNLVLVIDPVVPKDTDLKEYARQQFGVSKEALPGFSLIKEAELAMPSGIAAYEIAYKYNPADGVSLFQKQVFMIIGEKGYTFTATFSKSTINTIAHDVEQVIASFTPEAIMNTKFDVPLDQKFRIKVESHLLYCMWTAGRAWANCDAPFEIRTSFVGEGAEVKYKLKNDSGKTLHKDSIKIYGNRYRGTAPIPAKVREEDMLHLEIELPKQKLSGESNEIPAYPQIQVQKMQWDRKEVRRGDTVTLQAQFIDMPDEVEAELQIYSYDSQGYHDPLVTIPTQITKNKIDVQWEFDFHDDTGEIPTDTKLKPYNKQYAHPEYFFMIVIDGIKIGEKQESGLLRFKDWTAFILHDENDLLLPNTKAKLTFADNTTQTVTSDDDAIIYVEDIPPGATEISFPEEQDDEEAS